MLTACARPTPSPLPLPTPLIFYNWQDDMPQAVLDAFTAESGVPVTYLTYESMEEAVANIQAGAVYDVVNLDHRFIPELAEAGRLAVINRQHVLNFKNISANFRGLVYDPQNQYSIPYNWGTTGLVVRSDLIAAPVTRWADLWDGRIAGKVALWRGEPREVLGLALRSLGYSANSERPAELEAALARLCRI